MNPQIDFKHVLGELSVNRNDPCEVVRELISNSYDASAKNIRYAAINSLRGFVYWDDGVGLHRTEIRNGITPYEAFFSIGKSTKTKGDAIGYKCQGSKLCFASSRIFVLSRTADDPIWYGKVIENPRQTLGPEIDIEPVETSTPWVDLANFCGTAAHDSAKVSAQFDQSFFEMRFKTGTLISVQSLDVENFTKYLLGAASLPDSYLTTYIRFSTRHGDTRVISTGQGFKPNQVKQISTSIGGCSFEIFNGQAFESVTFGFPYLSASVEADIKSPLDVARLRDGRFSARYAKRFKYGNDYYSLILAIDGNRRAHVGYAMLDRKGAAKSGLRLSDQRGVAISVNGIKVCLFNDIFLRSELEDYQILRESDSTQHYLFVIDGPFDLVTNRNSLSKSAAGVFEDGAFIAELKKFLDDAKQNTPVFSELVSRLNREQREAKLNQQIEILRFSKESIAKRERFRIGEGEAKTLFVSPQPGEEYLVGVLYALLREKLEDSSPYTKYWKKIFTFSTQGIDSVACDSGESLETKDLVSVEYKYEFSNSGPFNHALCLVNFIVAWNVILNDAEVISDDYDCFGVVRKVEAGIYEIYDIEDKGGSSYDQHIVTVVSLKELIRKTWPNTTFKTPPASRS